MNELNYKPNWVQSEESAAIRRWREVLVIMNAKSGRYDNHVNMCDIHADPFVSSPITKLQMEQHMGIWYKGVLGSSYCIGVDPYKPFIAERPRRLLLIK